jgi:hypothetical protein
MCYSLFQNFGGLEDGWRDQLRISPIAKFSIYLSTHAT